jgi:hypothetical protein
MTTPLGPVSRNLVAAARSGLDPSAASAARVRARVALAVGAGASPGAAASAPSVASGPAAVARKLAVTKLAAIVATMGALVVGGWFAMSRATSTPQVPEISLSAPSLEVTTSRRAHVTWSAHDELVAAPGVSSTTVPRLEAVVSRAAASPTPTVAGPDAAATLAREVALLDAAIAALKAGAPAEALSTLAIYARETRDHGQLAEDAAALEIDARCRLHEPVDAQVAAFVARWPSSVQRARGTRACGAP